MAVANPCFQQGWDEWMEDKNGRRQWRERASEWANVEVSEEKDDGGEVRKVVDVAGREEEEEGKMAKMEAKELAEGGKAGGCEADLEFNRVKREVGRNQKEEGEMKIKSEEVEEEEAQRGEAGGCEVEMEVNRVERDVRQNQEMVEREGGVMGAGGEMEEEIERNMDNELKEEEMNEGEQVEEGGDQKEQNEEDQRDETENLSDSVKSDQEDLDWMGSEDESYDSERENDDVKATEKQRGDPQEVDNLHENSSRNENCVQEDWTSNAIKEEDRDEKLLDEEDTVTEWCSMHVENFQDYQDEEEDSTDDEEAEHSSYEDVDCSDEDVTKICRKEDYPTDIFCTLTEFRYSSLLTDLMLSTEDGKNFHVHSLVLAAVSSFIWETLSTGNVQNKVDLRNDKWSLCLGPEVDHVGLEAIVEFAYSGHVSHLTRDTMEQIMAAAQALGAHRVMDLCAEEDSAQTGGKKTEKRVCAAEQMMISLQSIRQMWVDGVGCDVILEGTGESLPVHRVILAASSDYFRGMFTLGMKESHQPRVNLPFLLASELETLIGCSYSGGLPLNWKCVFELTSTALQLQYQPALSLCLNFLQEEINPQSCLDVASFAEAYEMSQLLEVADDFVLRQFQKVSCTLKFKDLPAQQLLKYLNSRSLCVTSELVVFKAVVAWIQAKPKTRLKLAKELMKTVHFPLMTFKEFKEVQSANMWSDHRLVKLNKTIFEDFCSNEIAPQSQYRTYLPKESLVLIGGDQICDDLGKRTVSRELWFGHSLRNHTGIVKAMEWRRLGEMPEPPRFSHEVAVLDGQLYVFGGKSYYGVFDSLNCAFKYDPNENSWESLPEMRERRCFFSAVVLDGQIYAIGGHCEPDYKDSVERYCPTTNLWSFTSPLDLPLSGHVAKVSQGQIFVSGGLNEDYMCLASMFRYHPETGSTYLANMTKPRAYHCMEALGDCLYVAGGITVDENMTAVDQLTCEVYSPVTDTWTAFMSLPVPHVGAGSAVLEGKFYVLGGYHVEDYSDTKLLHHYDPATQMWENIGKMPGPNNDIRASVLSLPQHFRI